MNNCVDIPLTQLHCCSSWVVHTDKNLKPNYSLTFSGFFAKKTKKFTYVQSPPQSNKLQFKKKFLRVWARNMLPYALHNL